MLPVAECRTSNGSLLRSSGQLSEPRANDILSASTSALAAIASIICEPAVGGSSAIGARFDQLNAMLVHQSGPPLLQFAAGLRHQRFPSAGGCGAWPAASGVSKCFSQRPITRRPIGAILVLMVHIIGFSRTQSLHNCRQPFVVAGAARGPRPVFL